MMVQRRNHFLERREIAIVHRQQCIFVRAFDLTETPDSIKCRCGGARQSGNTRENFSSSAWRLFVESNQRVPKKCNRARQRFRQGRPEFLPVSRFPQQVLPQLEEQCAEFVLYLYAM